MPFDDPGYLARYKEPEPETPAMRRAILVEALRNEEVLDDWIWDFSIVKNDCGTAGCALGMALKIWPDGFPVRKELSALTLKPRWTITYQWVGVFFGIPTDRVGIIFDKQGYSVPMKQVTPAMVADKLAAVKDNA